MYKIIISKIIKYYKDLLTFMVIIVILTLTTYYIHQIGWLN